MLTREQLQEKFASYAKERGQKLAEFMVEWIQPGHITTDYVSLLLESKRMRQGDIPAKKLRKGLKVWTMVPGTIPLKGEITVTERANYIWDMAQISVTANVWELDSGELGTVDEIRAEMQAKLKDFYMGKVFTALTTVWTAGNTPSNYTAIGSEVTKTGLDNMIENVINAAGNVRAIAGVRDALLPITEFAGWASLDSTAYSMADSVKEELIRTGWVGQYKGIPLVVIPKDKNNPEDNQVLVPTDKVLVIGDKVGTFATFNDPISQEYTDMRIVPAQWNLTIAEQFGMIIDNAQGIGVLKLS